MVKSEKHKAKGGKSKKGKQREERRKKQQQKSGGEDGRDVEEKEERKKTNETQQKPKKKDEEVTKDEAKPLMASQRPKGLPNLGNTCFFNSTMQCLLANLHILRRYLDEVTTGPQTTEVSNGTQNKQRKGEDQIQVLNGKKKSCEFPMPTICKFAKLIDDYHSEGLRPNPRFLFDQISQKVPRFRGAQQQDAHELLRYLMDMLRQDEINRLRHAFDPNNGTDEKEVKTEAEEANALTKRGRKREETESISDQKDRKCPQTRPMLDIIYGGTLQQTITCVRCRNVNVVLEPFFDLSLPLKSSPVPPHFDPILPQRQKTERKTTKGKGKKRIEQQTQRQNRKNQNNNNNNEVNEPENDEDDEIEENQHQSSDGDDRCEKEEEVSYDEESLEAENGCVGTASGIDQLDCEFEQQIRHASRTRTLAELHNNDEEEQKDEDHDHEEKENNTCVDALSVQRALRAFTATELLLSRTHAYRCEKCRDKAKNETQKVPPPANAFKRYLIIAPPLVLTLHLKRFEQTNNRTARKFNGHVRFPMLLDLAPYCGEFVHRIRPGQRKILYQLYGVVSHSGGMSGGHYIAFVRRQSDGESNAHRLDRLLKQLYSDQHPGSCASSADPTEQLAKKLRDMSLQARNTNDNDSIKRNSDREQELEQQILLQTSDCSHWFYCSDSHVSPVSSDRVLNAQAYMLFYERIY